MAINSLRGDAQDINQKQTFTLTGITIGGIWGIVINGKTVTYTAVSGDTNATGATALQAILVASTIAEFHDVSWSVSSNIITGESAVAGTPFTATVTSSGGVSLATAVTQTATGKNFVDSAPNWSLGRVPAGECSPPVQSGASAVSGGTLVDTTTYYWVITATNALGESLKSNQQSLVISAPNQTANLSWAQVVGATGYKVYRSTTTNVYTPTALRATIGSGTTVTYQDTGGALSAGAVPSSNTALGDDVYMKQSTTGLLYGTDLNYVMWNSLHVDATFTGDGGLPQINPLGYYEYRNTHLKISPKTIYFGENALTGGTGPGYFAIDYGSNTTSWLIYATGSPKSQGTSSLYIKGSGASSIVIQQGYVGICVDAGETANFATSFEIGYRTSPSSDVNLVIGSGCTLNTISQLGGVVRCNANVAALTTTSGSQGAFYLEGAATMGTLLLDGGVYYHQSSGTITSAIVNPGGVFDHTQDIRAFTITNLTLRDGCTFLDPAHSILYGNPIFIDGSIENMKVDFGTTYHIAFS